MSDACNIDFTALKMEWDAEARSPVRLGIAPEVSSGSFPGSPDEYDEERMVLRFGSSEIRCGKPPVLSSVGGCISS